MYYHTILIARCICGVRGKSRWMVMDLRISCETWDCHEVGCLNFSILWGLSWTWSAAWLKLWAKMSYEVRGLRKTMSERYDVITLKMIRSMRIMWWKTTVKLELETPGQYHEVISWCYKCNSCTKGWTARNLPASIPYLTCRTAKIFAEFTRFGTWHIFWGTS